MPEGIRIRIKDDGRVSPEDVPRALRGFALQLPWAPACVPEVHAEAALLDSRRDRLLERFTSGDHVDIVENPTTVGLGSRRPQQGENAIWRHRTAHEERRGLPLGLFQFWEQAGERDVGPTVDDQAHRAFRTVLGQEDHRLGEVRIRQAARGDQQLAGRQFLHRIGPKLSAGCA